MCSQVAVHDKGQDNASMGGTRVQCAQSAVQSSVVLLPALPLLAAIAGQHKHIAVEGLVAQAVQLAILFLVGCREFRPGHFTRDKLLVPDSLDRNDCRGSEASRADPVTNLVCLLFAHANTVTVIPFLAAIAGQHERVAIKGLTAQAVQFAVIHPFLLIGRTTAVFLLLAMRAYQQAQ